MCASNGHGRMKRANCWQLHSFLVLYSRHGYMLWSSRSLAFTQTPFNIIRGLAPGRETARTSTTSAWYA